MSAFFVAYNTTLTPGQLAAKRRRLAGLLRSKGIDLRTLALGEGKSIVQRLTSDTHGAAVIVLDDEHSEPARSPLIQQLLKQTSDLILSRRPQLIYVTLRTTAAGVTQLLDHPIVRHYVKRDAKGTWVKNAAVLAGTIVRQMQATTMPSPAPDENDDGIVGDSACFREAVEELGRIIRLPYGMVSGEAGVGKMFLIQSLWQSVAPDAPLVVLPCGSFFKDYYVGGSRRRFGGGREAVDQLQPYISEAEDGLLVLHHVERLPTALQEELVARLAMPRPGAMKNPVVGVDSQGLASNNVRIMATSDHTPEDLRRCGLIDELAIKLAKRHVCIPSLVQRGPEDVQSICHDILRRLVRRQTDGNGDWTKLVPHFDATAMQLLRRARCPNNISDLLRWMEYAWRHCHGGTIQRSHLPPDIAVSRSRPAGTLDQIVDDAQRAAILHALDQTGGDMSQAAEILGRNKHALYRLMDKLGMKQSQHDA
jgi:DNA-binding NtrC family response regulator